MKQTAEGTKQLGTLAIEIANSWFESRGSFKYT
jgi:hypothetical protein